VDLLDTASARVRMSLDTVPEPLTRMKAQLTALEMEKQALLEDIALGNSATANAWRHRAGRNPLILRSTTLTQYGGKQLTELAESLPRISPARQKLRPAAQAYAATATAAGLDVDVRTVAR
jgi:type VI secretion system protein VasG